MYIFKMKWMNASGQLIIIAASTLIEAEAKARKALAYPENSEPIFRLESMEEWLELPSEEGKA